MHTSLLYKYVVPCLYFCTYTAIINSLTYKTLVVVSKFVSLKKKDLCVCVDSHVEPSNNNQHFFCYFSFLLEFRIKPFMRQGHTASLVNTGTRCQKLP